MRFPLLLALVLACALAVGCGSDDDAAPSSATATNPVASTPDATTPPADATQPGTGPVTPPPVTQTQPPPSTTSAQPPPEDGDEQQVRVPATFVVVGPARLQPPTITVPPFLAVELSLRAEDGQAHRLVLETPTPTTLDLPAGGQASVRIAGLRAGRYAVLLDGERAGALVAGGEVGP